MKIAPSSLLPLALGAVLAMPGCDIHDDSSAAADTAPDQLAELAAAAVTAPPTGVPPYYITADGQVRTATGTFDSLADWYASRDFHARPHCEVKPGPGIRLPTASGIQRPLASPSDCTLSFTDIETEYALQTTNLVIPVVFHNIVRSDNVGFVPNERFLSQIDVLNEDFGMLEGTPGDGGAQSNDVRVRFVLAGIRRIQNDAWFNFPSAYEEEYKAALHWDPSRYLNIYTIGIPEDDVTLGWAYYPQDTAGESNFDGIVALYDVIGRGSPHVPFTEGRTITHEVGHYLGLLHTFAPNGEDEGTCENGWNAGDLIQDTPAEEAATYDCPAMAQTCGMNVPSTMGNVHNYMNYTDDACMFYFTIQQANRAVCSLVNYRPNLYRVVPSTYHVSNFIESEGAGAIYIPKARIPAGSEIVVSALPNTPSNVPTPPANVRVRLMRKFNALDDWEIVGEDFSSGHTHASIAHTVPAKAIYAWSVSREGGGTTPPHAASATYLNCYDEDAPDHIKDIPECQD